MQRQKRRLSCRLSFPVALLSAVLLCVNCAWAGARERTLYEFPDGSNGGGPLGTMIFDNAGNLYGLAAGGAYNDGVVFKLTPSVTGHWTESVIYSFSNPVGNPGPNVVFDGSGSLYGSEPSSTCGDIYQLAQGANGIWTENTIFTFTDTATQGCDPLNLIFDPTTGNLYGEAFYGGAFNAGTVFALTPIVGGGWNFDLIYNFGSNGSQPFSSLTLDSAGGIYGETQGGGSYNGGIVFRLAHGTSGWTESVLYNFTGGDNGYSSNAGLVFDRQGNLYGTSTAPSGADDVGNIYKLSPTKGDWIIHVIHTFTGGPDGGNPVNYPLAIDGAGNIYGESNLGGLYGYGNAFKLSPSTGGSWKETVLHSFTNGADGGYPEGGVALDSSWNLYGTAGAGGTYGDGVAFEVKQ